MRQPRIRALSTRDVARLTRRSIAIRAPVSSVSPLTMLTVFAAPGAPPATHERAA
jgi:hypothetical protein